MKTINEIVKGNSNDIYLIAEAGVNHDGSIDNAKKLIEEAASAGADAIKFQSYKAGKLASKNSPSYWDLSKQPITSQYELFTKYDSFGAPEYIELAEHAKKVGIDFMSTPFDLDAAEFLNDLMPAFKIASADLTNHPFLKKLANYNKPLILSTGASTIGEIESAVRVIEEAGNKNIALLHCVLSYPTQHEDAHLNMIKHIKTVFPQYTVGYSDHTFPDDSMVSLTTAALLGAKIIEKHFTLDKTLKGNDHFHSMDPSDVRTFINNMNKILPLLGKNYKEPLEAEKNAIKFARRSLVANVHISKGEEITEEMITWKRPGTGISPIDYDKVIGRLARVDIKEDDILTWDMI
ncbi:N-acetylneuraminate synthase family protein [Rossellomorea sp. KS-H15a]|nr:N-acetylneuraminate synthase family protein [Rossellomorea sp. KS-H15a]UTE77499.1 N-acetylneuraminate synthase family protein [Rossellomorea sp. KS-H15a]